MLANRNRLLKEVDFKRIREKGKLYQSDNFGVSVLFRKDKKPPRFGFVVSTKVSKRATQRNRIKRALSEAVRQNVTRMKSGYDVIFLPKKSIETMSIENIMAETKKFIFDSNFYKKRK